MRLPNLCAVLTACLLSASAYADGFEIEPIVAKHPKQDYTYRFPKVQGTEPAARAVDIWLHTVELMTLPGRYRQSPMENVWPQGDSFSGVTELDFTIDANNERFLSIEVFDEYAGAYLERHTDAYNFDRQTGTPIGLADLFTKTGLARLKADAATKRVAMIRKNIASLDPKDESSAEGIALYEDCIPKVRASELAFETLVLQPGQVTMTRDYCGAHVNRPLEDLGGMTVTEQWSEIRDLLNDYGRCLLAPQLAARVSETPCVPAPQLSPRAGVYAGTIGDKSRITMVICPDGIRTNDRCGYFYDKYGQFIALSTVSAIGNTLVLNERAPDFGPVLATLTLTTTADGTLTGLWKAMRDGKTLPIRLQPIR